MAAPSSLAWELHQTLYSGATLRWRWLCPEGEHKEMLLLGASSESMTLGPCVKRSGTPAVCLHETLTDVCRWSSHCIWCFHAMQAGRCLTGSLAAACSSSSSSLKPKRAAKRMALSTRSGSAHAHNALSEAVHVRLGGML